jgi:hypothetical protein
MFRENKDSKIFIILIASLVLFTLIPYLVNASVNEVDEYPEATTSVHPAVYLAHGSGYGHTNKFYVAESGIPLNVVSGTIIYMNKSDSISYLQVNNTLGIPIQLWINGSLPSNVVMYVNQTSYRNPSPWTLGDSVNLAPSSVINIGFNIQNNTPQPPTYLYFDYESSTGVNLIYVYPIYVNK